MEPNVRSARRKRLRKSEFGETLVRAVQQQKRARKQDEQIDIVRCKCDRLASMQERFVRPVLVEQHVRRRRRRDGVPRNSTEPLQRCPLGFFELPQASKRTDQGLANLALCRREYLRSLEIGEGISITAR